MNTNQQPCCQEPMLKDLDKSRVTLIDEVYGMKQHEWDIKTCLACKCLTFIKKEQKKSKQDGAVVARLAHTQKVVGSTPTPAPKKSTKIKTRRKK